MSSDSFLVGRSNHCSFRLEAGAQLALRWCIEVHGLAPLVAELLQRAAESSRNEESKQQVAFALFECYAASGQWKEAEAILPQAWSQLSAQEIQERHSRMALLAARDGSKDDALRLWFRTANLVPTATHGLTELASCGLREDLVTFYRAMQKELPGSRAPAKALNLLLGMAGGDSSNASLSNRSETEGR